LLCSPRMWRRWRRPINPRWGERVVGTYLQLVRLWMVWHPKRYIKSINRQWYFIQSNDSWHDQFLLFSRIARTSKGKISQGQGT
jgi:hypothetical protein